MKRAEAKQIGTLARQRDILPDDLVNGIPGVKLIQK